jgi:putative tryptophan/tyrosine transport system substrate-binding protein
MRRRQFIALAGGILIAPLAARAQQASKVWRIGVLETVPKAPNAANFDAFQRGLRELGYIEGRNYVVEYRSADGRAERYPDLAAELVRMPVDIIITRGTPAVRAARQATDEIPIVMAAIGEPLGMGVVVSLARPGGNVTGFSAFVTELSGKRVEILREAFPNVSRVGFLNNMSNPVIPPQWEETQRAAKSLGIEAKLLDGPTREKLVEALDAAPALKLEAILVGIDGVTQANAKLIIERISQMGITAVYASREFVDVGGLMTYSPSYPHLYYRAARVVDKILKGARPGDLPVEQPTKLELVINLKTAKAMGFPLSPVLIARADEVIE